MKTNLFFGCRTSDEVRQRYDELTRVFNTSNNGENNEMISTINDQYDQLLSVLDKPKTAEAVNEKATVSEKIKELQEKVNPEGLHIEIIKNWLWVTGKTYQVKDVLKNLHFRYSSQKLAWYYRKEDHRSFNQEPIPLDQIRELYGSKEVALK